MEAIGVSLYQLLADVYHLVRNKDSIDLSSKVNIISELLVSVLLVVRMVVVDDRTGDFIVALVLIGSMKPETFYYSLLRTVSLFSLTLVDTASGETSVALTIYYSMVSFMSCFHAQIHLK